MDEKKPVVSPEKKRNLKKTLTSIFAIALVAVISVFATLAYLGTNSNDETNTFLGSEGIEVELEEEEWTKKTTEEPHVTEQPHVTEGPNVTEEPHVTEQPHVTEGPSEEERARDYTPGGVYLKNPTLTNKSKGTTGGSPQEWVAMKVSFEIGEKNNAYDAEDPTSNRVTADKDKSTWGVFNEIADVIYTKSGTDKKQFNTDDWLLVATSSNPNGNKSGVTLTSDDSWAIYVYRIPLNVGATTNALFNKVQMKDQSVFEEKPSKDHAYIRDGSDGKTVYELPAININVIGAAIKVEDANKGTAWANCVDQDNVMKELLGLLENK
ncbi:MAG: hypothetical protein HDT30_04665 [Clostridiales bacterium]|nr:hypothetical protein [Clostridiales bacterium]